MNDEDDSGLDSSFGSSQEMASSQVVQPLSFVEADLSPINTEFIELISDDTDDDFDVIDADHDATSADETTNLTN